MLNIFDERIIKSEEQSKNKSTFDEELFYERQAEQPISLD